MVKRIITVKQLRRQVAIERKKVAKLRTKQDLAQEKKALQRELIQLKHAKKIRVVKAIGRGSARVGGVIYKGLEKVGTRVAEVQAEQKRKPKRKRESGFGFQSPF